MIIACPACATRYVVPDSAIGPEGRTVRCAKCKHSWYQDGPELAEPVAAPHPEARPEKLADVAPGAQYRSRAEVSPPPSSEDRAEVVEPGARRTAAAIDDQHGNGHPEQFSGDRVPPASQDQDLRANWDDESDEVVAASGGPSQSPALTEGEIDDDLSRDDIPPPVEWAGRVEERDHGLSDDVSHFDHEPPFRPRRNWLRWLTWGAGAFAALALAAVVAMQYFGLPSWLPIDRPMFGPNPGLEVEFPASEQERRTLPNGSEFFGARVVVKNTTRETKTVPPLLIVLLDARERVVYSWELLPPQRTLAPGEEQTINEAMTDVPKSAVYADIGWAPR